MKTRKDIFFYLAIIAIVGTMIICLLFARPEPEVTAMTIIFAIMAVTTLFIRVRYQEGEAEQWPDIVKRIVNVRFWTILALYIGAVVVLSQVAPDTMKYFTSNHYAFWTAHALGIIILSVITVPYDNLFDEELTTDILNNTDADMKANVKKFCDTKSAGKTRKPVEVKRVERILAGYNDTPADGAKIKIHLLKEIDENERRDGLFKTITSGIAVILILIVVIASIFNPLEAKKAKDIANIPVVSNSNFLDNKYKKIVPIAIPGNGQWSEKIEKAWLKALCPADVINWYDVTKNRPSQDSVYWISNLNPTPTLFVGEHVRFGDPDWLQFSVKNLRGDTLLFKLYE